MSPAPEHRLTTRGANREVDRPSGQAPYASRLILSLVSFSSWMMAPLGAPYCLETVEPPDLSMVPRVGFPR
jgi:hypothetical protein